MKRKPNRKTLRDAMRASVPEGKLKTARIIISDKAMGESPVGGYTQYERENGGRVIKISAPSSDDAWGVTVRGHETAHASRHKPTRKKPMTENEAKAGQIVDDVNLEMQDVPKTKFARAYKRDHLAIAFRDLRVIKRTAKALKGGTLKSTPEIRNAQLIHAVRTAAMIKNYGNGTMEELRVRQRGFEELRNALGHKTVSAILTVVSIARRRRMRAKAISMLVSLMEKELEEDLPEFDRPPIRDGDILSPVQDGDALDGHMKITDLRPKSVFTAKERTVSKRYAPDGVHLNAGRFVNAIVSGESHGLFSRRVRQKPGGTVLIDASGSMGANRYNLSALCELMPTATVAYYSGTAGGRGELVVYAFQGKRFAGNLPEETIHGGNSVDLPAIRWMMKLPKPWTLISDLEFCSGVLGSEAVAHALVERAVERGDLTVYRSLDAAWEGNGGKGELQNEPKGGWPE